MLFDFLLAISPLGGYYFYMSKHLSHAEIVKRLKRAEGHLKSTIAMLDEEKPCVHVAQQLYAVECAIASAKKTLIYDHINHCLDDVVVGEGTLDVLEEFKQITKYL